MTDLSPSDTIRDRDWRFFAFAFVILMVACIILPRAVTFLPPASGLIFFVYYHRKTGHWPAVDRNLTLFLGALLVMAALSALWAPDFTFSLMRAVKTTAIFAAGLIAYGFARLMRPFFGSDRLALLLPILCGFAGFVLASEYLFDFPIARKILGVRGETPASITNGFLLNRSTVYLVILSLPVLFLLRLSTLSRPLKYAAALFLFGGVAAVLAVTQSQTSQIAVIIALAAWLYPVRYALARQILMGALVITVIASPFLIGPASKAFFAHGLDRNTDSIVYRASVPHRLEVWRFFSDEIVKSPWVGHGIESARFLRSDTRMHYMATDRVMHPHNAVLQLWLEFGVIGSIWAIAFIIFLLRRFENLAPLPRRYAYTVFITLTGVLSMGYGLWQPWQLATLMAITSFSVMAARMYPERAASLPG